MLVVVDIANWLYDAMMGHREPIYSQSLGDAVRDGIPLPKGCGRLIILSEDAVKRELIPSGVSCQYWISEVGLSNATVRIIEADKAESDVPNFESKEYIEQRLENYNKLLKSGMLDCVTEKPQESEDKE